MQFNKKYVLSNLKDCVMIMIGLVLYAVGFCGFVLPKGVVIGGMAGLASLI